MRNQHAFTLIELLVVISIIALLMALLLPALSRSRSAGKAVSCMSNQRQLYIPLLSYTQANKDFVPYHSYNEYPNIRHVGWLGRLTRGGFIEPYSETSPGARYCPELSASITQANIEDDSRGHYPMLNGTTTYINYDLADPKFVGEGITSLTPLKLDLFLKPSINAAYVDGMVTNYTGQSGAMSSCSVDVSLSGLSYSGRWKAGINSPLASTSFAGGPPEADRRFRHLSTVVNFTFLDGHVERRKYNPGNMGGFGVIYGAYATRNQDS
jgi:prepilin-type N-terminal cleavage/methylation domain-containing protein/prepilin-type processing-associated H-X9-DG protein